MEMITSLQATPVNLTGLTDVELLVRKTGSSDSETETVSWVEYWNVLATVAIDPDTNEQILSWPTDPLDPDGARTFKVYPPAGEGAGFHPPIQHNEVEGVCVHRSAHLTLKAVPEEVQTMLGQIAAG